jgi:hypothetical protein
MSAAEFNTFASDLDPAALEILKSMKQAMEQKHLELQQKNDRLDQQLIPCLSG